MTAWWLVCALAFVAPRAAKAQHEGHQSPAALANPAPVDTQACRSNAAAAVAALESLSAQLEDARQQNGQTALRAAVGDAQLTVARLKPLLAACTASRTGPSAGSPAQDHQAGHGSGPDGGAAHLGTPAPATAQGALRIDVVTDPSPPKAGVAQLDITVRSADGRDVDDAVVDVVLVMPAMPSMNMPEMRHPVSLTPAGQGHYRGVGMFMMAGPWTITITVSRNGLVLGTKALTTTVR